MQLAGNVRIEPGMQRKASWEKNVDIVCDFEAEESCSAGRRLWEATVEMYVGTTSGETLVLYCSPRPAVLNLWVVNLLGDQIHTFPWVT